MRFLQSIRWRLQIWYGLLLLAVLGGFNAAVYRVEGERQLRSVDEELQRRLQVLANSRHPVPNARPPRQKFELLPQNAALFDQEGSGNFYYAIWLHGSDMARRSSSAPADLPSPREGTPSWTRTRGVFREAFLVPAPGDFLLVGHSIERELGEVRHLAYWLAAASGGVLLLGLVGGGWLIHRALKPIRDISDAAQKVATGDLTQRIANSPSGSELGQLVNVLNSTFARLDSAFAQQARFTADAAHELRTPVSVMLAQAQDGLTSTCDNPEHCEAFEASQRAANRMRRLIDSLLELARLDAGQESLSRHPCDLATLVADCVEQLRPIAAQRSIQIHTDLAPTVFRGDADRITQVITNLVSNAIEHNCEGGSIHIGTRGDNGMVSLTVQNTGSGISPEDLPRIFDRFYRADKARTGKSGHTGLGLAITKAIVQSHGGSIHAASEDGTGATFTVTLPS